MSGRLVPVHEGLFGIAIGPLVRALFSYLTSWVATGSAALVTSLGHILSATGGPDLGAPLAPLMTRTLAIGVALTLPLVLLAVLKGVLRGDVSLVVGAVLVRVPLAAVLGAAALDLVRLAVGATDQMSADLLDSVSGPVGNLFHGLAAGLVATGGGSPGLPGFGVVLLAVAAAAVSFLLWLELVVRGAAIEVATLFVPLALAGLVWPATAHWSRRLAETIGALVLSKVVVAGVLALAAATLGSASGVEAVVQGVALLALAAFAPYALLRLVPALEAASLAQLEGLGRRGLRAGSALASSAGRLPDLGGAWDIADLLPPVARDGAGGAARVAGGGGGAGVAGGGEAIGFVASRFDPAAFTAALAGGGVSPGVAERPAGGLPGVRPGPAGRTGGEAGAPAEVEGGTAARDAGSG